MVGVTDGNAVGTGLQVTKRGGLHARGLEDVPRYVVAVLHARHALDDSAENHVADVAVALFRAGLELEVECTEQLEVVRNLA